MQNTILLLIIILVLLFIVCILNFKENLTIPPFKYPTYLQQPQGPEGWGFRDPNATRMTLEWQQCQKPLLMPDFSPQRLLTGYRPYMVQSQPVPVKTSNCKIPQQRPPIYRIQQRNVANAPYSTWAGTVGAALPLSP
jgi:hypothetical protein